MNAPIRPFPVKWLCPLSLVACLLVSSPGFALDFRIPLPPSPDRVLRDLRSLLHRGAGDVKSAPARRAPRNNDRDDAYNGGDAVRDFRTTPAHAAPSVKAPRREDLEEQHSREEPRPQSIPDFPKTSRDISPASPPPRSDDSSQKAPIREDSEPTADTAKTAPLREATSAAGKVDAPDPKSDVAYAKPVPGKQGLVYAPGVQESPDNIIDVAGYQPGQLVRDPRTGTLFRVP